MDCDRSGCYTSSMGSIHNGDNDSGSTGGSGGFNPRDRSPVRKNRSSSRWGQRFLGEERSAHEPVHDTGEQLFHEPAGSEPETAESAKRVT
jgi:hypothetical protein